jgi:hypothetical protein
LYGVARKKLLHLKHRAEGAAIKFEDLEICRCENKQIIRSSNESTVLLHVTSIDAGWAPKLLMKLWLRRTLVRSEHY